MKKVNYIQCGLTALTMAFAMTLCYSCSNDDEDAPKEETIPPSNGGGEINGHAYVELAGIKWATENVGKCDDVEADGKPGSNSNKWGCYYYSQSGATDVAKKWGDSWKLPTSDQWRALIEKCKWEWTTTLDGKEGYTVSDNENSSKSIFLPAAGYLSSGGTVYDQGSLGNYWSSNDKQYLDFHKKGYKRVSSYYGGYKGMVVRLVVK